jgi:hypothetical protein
MPYICKLADYTDDGVLEIGTIWLCPPTHIHVGTGGRLVADSYILSVEYLRDWQSQRQPLFVWMPKGYAWCIDSAFSDRNPIGPGWTVTGDAPNITVTPSIHHVGIYHGWLTNGVLSDG